MSLNSHSIPLRASQRAPPMVTTRQSPLVLGPELLGGTGTQRNISLRFCVVPETMCNVSERSGMFNSQIRGVFRLHGLSSAFAYSPLRPVQERKTCFHPSRLQDFVLQHICNLAHPLMPSLPPLWAPRPRDSSLA